MSLDTQEENNYWTNRYENNMTGWDLGEASQPLISYVQQLKNKDLKILMPGAGNAHEAKSLFNSGFKNVYVLDISPLPLKKFKEENPSFPDEQLINGNFFEHDKKYDLILEQTFFCSFFPTKENRELYAKTMNQLLNEDGKLAGLWFNHALVPNSDKRPFGGSKEEYLGYFSPYFNTTEMNTCYNSHSSRKGKELFGIFKKK